MKRHAQLMVLIVLGLMAHGSPALADKSPTYWGYAGQTGPSHWAELNKDFRTCQLGQQQSPINIVGAKSADLPSIQFDYHAFSPTLINNGHTVQVDVAPGSSIRVGDQKYDLLQFHFHTPSEEQVNGKRYDMVWHLVHKNASGQLAVVAVLVKRGKENSFLAPISADLPSKEHQERKIDKVSLDLNEFLPTQRGYYQFQGSLTTPPCSEGVSWYVLKQPVEASAAQIAAFHKLFGNNARPVQALGKRTIQATR